MPRDAIRPANARQRHLHRSATSTPRLPAWLTCRRRPRRHHRLGGDKFRARYGARAVVSIDTIFAYIYAALHDPVWHDTTSA
jgi:hypothetical protein